MLGLGDGFGYWLRLLEEEAIEELEIMERQASRPPDEPSGLDIALAKQGDRHENESQATHKAPAGRFR